MKNLIKSTIIALILLNGQLTMAANFTGADVNPSVFEVTLKKIEFQNTAGTWVTFAEGNFTFDIASANAGEGVGSFAQGASLPNNTYNKARITTSRTYGMTFSGTEGGQPCRTQTGNGSSDWATGGSAGTITNTGIGSQSAGAGTKQQIPLGGNAAIDTALTNFGMTGTATELTFEATISSPFTIDENTTLPNIQISFDVTNAAEIKTTGVGTCRVFPQPPAITLVIS